MEICPNYSIRAFYYYQSEDAPRSRLRLEKAGGSITAPLGLSTTCRVDFMGHTGWTGDINLNGHKKV